MSDTESRFSVLRQSADPAAVAALEALVRDGADPDLNRVNVIEFAEQRNLPMEKALDAFLHASRLGMFDMSWNILCPGCGGVLHANATLRSVDRSEYNCAICAAHYEPTLDEVVEVSFTVNPRVRRIAAHTPHELPMWEYVRQMFWASGIVLPPPEDFAKHMQDMVLDWVEIGAGEKATMSVQLPPGFIIAFEPVTHAAVFMDIQGEPTRERQELGIVFNQVQSPTAKHMMRPGPLRLTLENRTDTRVLPALFIAGDALHHMLGRRKQFLTAQRLLTHQTFRNLFGAETLAPDQRLKITNLAFVFTDLKASTELYERVGDLAAYELVKAHFGVLGHAVASESGAVVKTIGDAVMATFPSSDRGIAAVLRMREAMQRLNESHGREDLMLKIGMHEGPCLAVTLNDRLDYFGQTVNIASRVQALADSASVFATEPVISHQASSELISRAGLKATPRKCALRGIADDYTVYEIG
ncbi:adenylate/guanylate cyclase domain-containing protein [Ramlibacter albus]|uniref:Adenylate/guanylate cyclase domain-containing protein n=1 Tax=Ramlibacter albus TaxID=2079448 RepID=A0A923MEH3_9BURK|nr:adenylate/guanylate cyclase domain-containing protein [Ramlibacter albus]MBC5768013.1 adenylate/guanylate cyclase domain-containing protein [Ramlibacter albus]